LCQVEDLDRATCLISDGDVALLLLSKTHGNLSYFELDFVLGLSCLAIILSCTTVGFVGAFLKMFLGLVNLQAIRKEVQLEVKLTPP
jgi:hypothetical protein